MSRTLPRLATALNSGTEGAVLRTVALEGVSTIPFGAYTVLPEISVARIAREAPHSKASVMGCGVPTGTGAVRNAARVEAGATVAAFGLGGSAWR